MHEKNSQDQITKALNAVNWKVLEDAEEKGKVEASKKIARKLKKLYTSEEISEITGLSIEEIGKL